MAAGISQNAIYHAELKPRKYDKRKSNDLSAGSQLSVIGLRQKRFLDSLDCG